MSEPRRVYFIDTGRWSHYSFSPATFEDYTEVHAQSSMVIIARTGWNEDLQEEVPKKVKSSDVFRTLSAFTMSADCVDLGELLAAARRSIRGSDIEERLVTASGRLFDSWRILDLGAALPYESGPVRWKVAPDREGAPPNCLYLAAEAWRCAIMGVDHSKVKDANAHPALLPFPEPRP